MNAAVIMGLVVVGLWVVALALGLFLCILQTCILGL